MKIMENKIIENIFADDRAFLKVLAGKRGANLHFRKAAEDGEDIQFTPGRRSSFFIRRDATKTITTYIGWGYKEMKKEGQDLYGRNSLVEVKTLYELRRNAAREMTVVPIIVYRATDGVALYETERI